MIDISTLTNQFFLLYAITLIFLVVITVISTSRLQARISVILFTIFGILLALYSTLYSGEKKIILLIAGGLINLYPFYAYAKDAMAIIGNLRVDAPRESIFSVINDYIYRRRSGKRCINPVKKKGFFETRSSEVYLSAEEGYVHVEGYPNSMITNIYRTLILVTIGYTYYVFYGYLGETELFKLVSPLTVISILVVILLVVLYNARGFVESNVESSLSHIKYEVREIEKALEIARVISIAKKFKKEDNKN